MSALKQKRIGEIMVSLGFCTGRTMQRVLRKQAKMLEAKGYALRIGHLLLEEGAVTEHELAMGLATQFKLGVVDLIGRELLVGLLKPVPEAITDKYPFVPIKKDRDGILIAVDEVLPRTVMEGLRRTFDCPVNLAIVPSSQLQKVQRWCKNHRRRLMAGQLDKVTLPHEYFAGEGGGDPESTIKPGSITVNSLMLPPPAAPPLEELAPPPVVPEEHSMNRSPEDSMSTSLSGSSRAARRARRLAERSMRLTPPPPGTPIPIIEPEPEPVPEPGEVSIEEPVLDSVSLPPEPATEEEPEPVAGTDPTDYPEMFDELPTEPGPAAALRPPSWSEVDSTEMARLPAMARMLIARPANLVSILRELKNGACETVTLAPRGAGADLLASDEDGTRPVGFITGDDYPGILDAGLELLDLDPAQAFPAAVERTLQATVDGEAIEYRVIALPSRPATLVFGVADRLGWRLRRLVREWAFVEPLCQRLMARRGLALVAGDPTLVSGVMGGLAAALRRARGRVALVTNAPGARVREVTTVPAAPDEVAGAVAPAALLGLTAAGLDVLALDVALTPDQLAGAVPFATDAALCVAVRERTTFDAVGALARTKLPPALLSSLLDVAISIHQADRLCPSCRKETVLQEAQVPPALKATKLTGVTVYEAGGCALCGGTGVRGTLVLPEVLTWDKTKATPDMLALDRKALVKRCFELQLAQPMAVEARKALLAGTLSFKAYLKLLGLAAV